MTTEPGIVEAARAALLAGRLDEAWELMRPFDFVRERRSLVRNSAKKSGALAPEETLRRHVLYVELVGKCQVCGSAGSSGRALCFDHDHRTGAYRGALCDQCNQALGQVGDDPDTLEALARYLRERGAR